jgi:hypothetical protein
MTRGLALAALILLGVFQQAHHGAAVDRSGHGRHERHRQLPHEGYRLAGRCHQIRYTHHPEMAQTT